jgi:excisionase family DNA binding protein
MSNYLTAKQVQLLLQVDRTTIYRMLQDGRLKGVKIGHHWRFDRDDVDKLLAKADSSPMINMSLTEVLPIHCVQSIQKVFAQIVGIGAITTNMEGEPITEINNCSEFCSLILNNPSGRKACIASWKKMADNQDKNPEFVPCHAGLQYARGYIEVEDDSVAMIVAGQFYAELPDPIEEKNRLRNLSKTHGLDLEQLSKAAQSIPQVDGRKQAQFEIWLQEVADTFSEIGSEKAEVLKRLKAISEMSDLNNKYKSKEISNVTSV